MYNVPNFSERSVCVYWRIDERPKENDYVCKRICAPLAFPWTSHGRISWAMDAVWAPLPIHWKSIFFRSDVFDFLFACFVQSSQDMNIAVSPFVSIRFVHTYCITYMYKFKYIVYVYARTQQNTPNRNELFRFVIFIEFFLSHFGVTAVAVACYIIIATCDADERSA